MERIDLKNQLQSLIDDLETKVSERNTTVQVFAMKIREELGVKGFSAANFTAKKKCLSKDDPNMRELKDAIAFYEKAHKYFSELYEMNKEFKSIQSSVFESIKNTNWAYYYYKDSISLKRPGCFCGFLSVGDHENNITFETHTGNLFAGKADLSIDGVIKFDLSLKSLRPLVLLGNIGRNLNVPEVYISSFSSLSQDSMLMTGFGVFIKTDQLKNEVIKDLNDIQRDLKTNDSAVINILRLFFSNPNRVYNKVGFVGSTESLQDVANHLSQKNLFEN